jgi:mono/diheme cytochrome c family protein
MKLFRNLLLIGIVTTGLLVWGGGTSTAEAKTLKVPSEFMTIETAIDRASAGDVVLVAPGRYKENIKLKKGIILRGSGSDMTTIDGGGKGNVVEGAEDSLIEGFTVTNSGMKGRTGSAMDVGISADHAPMTIANCRIVGNNGGIRVYYSPSNIVNNIISDNKLFGISNVFSDSTVKNNINVNNGDYGIIISYSTPKIINNTLYKNSGGIHSEVSKVVIKNNIIVKNSTVGIRWVEDPDAQDGVEPVLSYNLIWGNGEDFYHVSSGTGDLSKEPRFIDMTKGNFHLKTDSPAVNSGDEAGTDPDGTRSDIGAFGGSMAQEEIPLSPQVKSYADINLGTGIIKEPDYTSQAAWAGGTTSGEGNFQSYCVTCHGPEGKGDGMLAESLDVMPRDLTNAALISARSDDLLFKTIKGGGASVGLSENMISFEGQLSDEEIRNIITYIRTDICKCEYKGK